MLAKCLQILEMDHLKSNSLGDFLYLKMLQGVPIAFHFNNHELNNKFLANFFLHRKVLLVLSHTLIRYIYYNHDKINPL